MDPNEALAHMRVVAKQVLDEHYDGDEVEDRLLDLAERFNALDEWLSKGGFLPTAWKGRIDPAALDTLNVPKE